KNQRLFLLRGKQNSITNVQQIGVQGQPWAMLLQASEGQQAGALCLANALSEISRRQFLPMRGELGLRKGEGRVKQKDGNKHDRSSKHGLGFLLQRRILTPGIRLLTCAGPPSFGMPRS